MTNVTVRCADATADNGTLVFDARDSGADSSADWAVTHLRACSL